MGKYIGIGVLVIGIALVSYMGCDGAKARLGVAGDKAIEKIDGLLGKINVEQKKVENAYGELKSAMATVREKRIEAEVRVKSMQEKKDALMEKKGKIKTNLVKLQGLLKDASTEGFIERNGKKITAEQLKDWAEAGMKEMNLLKDQVTKNSVISNAWAKNLTVLKKQEDTSSEQLKKLENQLDQIRSKKSALDAMKEAASIAGPGASISDKFNDLTESVDELLVNLDTEFKIEEAKLDERAAELATESTVDIDELLNDKTDVSGTLDDLNKMLEEGGE